MSEFPGFTQEFMRFFDDLEHNNNRTWFTEHKTRYQETVVAPMMDFIRAMEAPLKSISPHYLAVAKPHGGSMFRIYRDTRFSKDKTPYKTHAAVQFRHSAGKDAHAPGFYAHFGLDGLSFGGGVWRPSGPRLQAIREFIVDNPAAWRKLRNASSVKKRGGIRGEQLKRPPRGFDPAHEHIEDLKHKSFYLMEEQRSDLLTDSSLVEQVVHSFRAARPLNHFICDALELPF